MSIQRFESIMIKSEESGRFVFYRDHKAITEDLLSALENLIMNHPFPDSVYADNARAAIAKARGEA